MSHYTNKKCPMCGAANSLTVDYQAAEVACTSCCYVIEGGLLEDPRTSFPEEGEGVVDAGWGMRDMAKLDGHVKRDKLWTALEALQGRTGVTENVIEAAQSYAQMFQAKQKATNASHIDPHTLAAACFYISSVIRQCPVLPHELESSAVLRGVDSSKIEAAKQKVLSANPDLSAEYSAAAADPFTHLVLFYGRRLKPTLTPAQCTVAAAIARKFSDVLQSGKSIGMIASLAIFVALTNATAVAHVSKISGVTMTPQNSGGRLLSAIAQATKWPVDDLTTFMKSKLSADKIEEWVRAATTELSTVATNADSALPLADVRKRPLPAADSSVAPTPERPSPAKASV